MAIICPAYNLLFIMTPRTGCTALGELLCAELGGRYLPADDILTSDGQILIQKKHSTLRQLLDQRLMTPEQRAGYRVAATVRNPFDSLVSLYVKKSRTYQPLLNDPGTWVHRVAGYADDMRYCQTHTFDDWIEKHFSRRMVDRLIGWRKKSLFRKYCDGVDVVLRYETLQADFDRLLQDVGISRHLTIPRLNTTHERQSDYRTYYSPRSRRIVERALSEDLARYSYAF